jgi:hypothetical protein
VGAFSIDERLVEFWNGKRWTIGPNPNPGRTVGLSGVSCVSARWCEAVGQTSLESWNGKNWTIQPNPSPSGSGLVAVSCVSATSCKAVGSGAKRAGEGYYNDTFVESWNGKKWTILSSPNVTTKEFSVNQLDGVWCVSATSCKAVGSAESYPTSETLVESWNGSKWTIQSSANATTKADSSNNLSGVWCKSATSCEAVGAAGTQSPTPTDQTLIESNR